MSRKRHLHEAEEARRREQRAESEALKGSPKSAQPKEDKTWGLPINPVASASFLSPNIFYPSPLTLTWSGSAWFGSANPNESQSPLKFPTRRLAGPVVGFRSWNAIAVGPKAANLKALAADVAWPDQKILARQTKSCTVKKKHRAPLPTCTCGIYAYKRLGPESANANEGQVQGAILGWGKMVEHGHEGFRIAHAQIIALTLRPPYLFGTYGGFLAAKNLTKIAAQSIKVPVVPLDALERYVSEFGDILGD
jgi:hypothetical protein